MAIQSRLIRSEMGQPSRPGNAVAISRCINDFGRTSLIDQMTRRNKDRIRPPFRTQHDADLIVLFIPQGRRISNFISRRVKLTHKFRFRTAKAWDSKPQSHMTSNAESTRVSDPLSIQHHGRGANRQSAKRFQ